MADSVGLLVVHANCVTQPPTLCASLLFIFLRLQPSPLLNYLSQIRGGAEPVVLPSSSGATFIVIQPSERPLLQPRQVHRKVLQITIIPRSRFEGYQLETNLLPGYRPLTLPVGPGVLLTTTMSDTKVEQDDNFFLRKLLLISVFTLIFVVCVQRT